MWSRDGRELFYINGNRMMVVDVIGTTAFSAPRQLFEDAFVESTNQVTDTTSLQTGASFESNKPSRNNL